MEGGILQQNCLDSKRFNSKVCPKQCRIKIVWHFDARQIHALQIWWTMPMRWMKMLVTAFLYCFSFRKTTSRKWIDCIVLFILHTTGHGNVCIIKQLTTFFAWVRHTFTGRIDDQSLSNTSQFLSFLRSFDADIHRRSHDDVWKVSRVRKPRTIHSSKAAVLATVFWRRFIKLDKNSSQRKSANLPKEVYQSTNDEMLRSIKTDLNLIRLLITRHSLSDCLWSRTVWNRGRRLFHRLADESYFTAECKSLYTKEIVW